MAKRELNVDLIPAIKRLQVLSRGPVTSTTTGEYKSVFKGKGLEFSDYREYTPTDDASLIDWKASSRAQKTLVREYIEERDINILFALDASSTMLFGSTEKLKIEYAIELVASLSNAMLDAGDHVGICLFTEKIVAKVLPDRGPQQFYKLSRILLDVDNYGGNIAFADLERFVMNSMKSSTIIVIVSDFLGIPPDWKDSVRNMGAKFELMGFMIRDPRDDTLPEGDEQYIIMDPYSKKELIIEPGLLKNAYEQEAKKQKEIIQYNFIHNKAEFLAMDTSIDFVKPITNFFRRRALKGLGW